MVDKVTIYSNGMKSSKYMQYNNSVKTPVQVPYAGWTLVIVSMEISITLTLMMMFHMFNRMNLKRFIGVGADISDEKINILISNISVPKNYSYL